MRNLNSAIFTVLLMVSGLSQAGTVEVIALRHGESLNNVLSQRKAPLSFFASLMRERNAVLAAQTLFQNPVLSSSGRSQALALHDMLFPSNKDPNKILSSDPEHKTVFFVSPLNRTIQTAVLSFGQQSFRSGVDIVANPYITEHRKSVSEEGFKDAKRPLALFENELEEIVKVGQLSQEESTSNSFRVWKNNFMKSMLVCCDEKVWWPAEPVETVEQIETRIAALKDQLKDLPDNSRVILVSHGTFLRALFYGSGEIKDKKYHIRNLGMLYGKFNQETKDWEKGSVSCFDPTTGKAAKGLDPNKICFDKIQRLNSFVVDKGPVYEVDGSPPTFGSWQTRELNIFKDDGLVGVTWNTTGSNSIANVKGAALIIGITDTCEIPVNFKQDRENLCLVIERVKINPKTGPVWEKAETGKWDVLRLSWKKSDEAATNALNPKNLLN